MGDHYVVWEFDQDCTRARLECRAPKGADCRLTGPEHCQCESWIIERATSPMATPFHRVATYGGADIIHWMCDGGECNVALFIDECVEESAGGRQQFTIAEVPVELSWEGDGYSWAKEEALMSVQGGPWTRHGHAVEGVTVDGPGRPQVARCGGPRLCGECALDAVRRRAEKVELERPASKADWPGVYNEVLGYVQQAALDSEPLDAVALHGYMIEVKNRLVTQPVRDELRRMRGA